MAGLYPDIDSAMISEFRAFYPEFTDATKFSDPLVLRALGVSFDEGGGIHWGQWVDPNLPYSLWKRAIYALTAFYIQLWLGGQQANGAAVTPMLVANKSIRDESTGNAVPQAVTGASYNDYLFTVSPYGMEWLRLRRRAGMGAMAV